MLALWFPQQTRMYRDFYISRTRDCWLPAGVEAAMRQSLPRAELDPPAFDAQTACLVLTHGWNRYPPWGRTAQLPVSWLDLPLLPGARGIDILLANTSVASTQVVWVRLDGGDAARLVLPPGQAPVELRLPLQAGSGNSVRLRFDRPHEPDGNPMAVLRLKWISN